MHVRKHFTLGLALLALALGLNIVSARAESMLTGSFELPAAAYWGDTLLQPGQYTIWMTAEMRDVTSVPVFHLTGEGVHKTFLAVAKPAKESGRNYLDIENIDGAYVIRAFDAGTIGESFAFSVTKTVKNKSLRASVAVPVAAE